ncbi:MAG: GNAT family N-acetyltransferase [Candidatus Heimdallarchaeota archaeon]|nr:GNAT family N-acetyltransferase [Candidatus Heimdallarchaeota archaeon]
MSSNDSEYLIEQFRLEEENFDNIAKLITDVFINDETALEEGASIAFSEQTFRTVYGAPSIDRDLFIRTIHKPTDKIVGFIGAIPRKLSIEGKEYKFAVPSWLCVHSQHQKKGFAKTMGKMLFEKGMEKGYDGAFSLHEPEQHGIDVSSAVSRDKEIPFQRIVTLTKFVIKAFNVDKVATVVRLRWYEKLVFKLYQKFKTIDSEQIRVFQEKDIPDMFEIIQEQVKRNQLSIVPELEDFKWMLTNPNVICVVHEDNSGKVKGFMLAWEFFLAGMGNKLPFGWLDMVHIHRLNSEEGSNLANYLCQICEEKGWYGLQTPYIPYFDMKPLKKAKFFFFSKKINLDVFNMRNVEFPEKVESFYFDWR